MRKNFKPIKNVTQITGNVAIPPSVKYQPISSSFIWRLPLAWIWFLTIFFRGAFKIKYKHYNFGNIPDLKRHLEYLHTPRPCPLVPLPALPPWQYQDYHFPPVTLQEEHHPVHLKHTCLLFNIFTRTLCIDTLYLNLIQLSSNNNSVLYYLPSSTQRHGRC